MATAGSSSDGRLDVAQLLAQRAASSGRPSIEVEKEDDLEYDLAHLAAFDPAPLSAEALSADAEAHLLETARDNAQLMANRLYAILASQESKAVIRLPPPTTQLPREKPLPKPRPQTRWEKFAAEKGIVKKKRSKMVWDEAAGQWAPRYGFGRANKQDDPLKTWLVPAKPGEDGSTDPFEAAAGKRGEARAKQKRQEERNRLEAAHAAGLTSRGKGAAAGAGGSLGSSVIARDLGAASEKKEYLSRAIRTTQVSTASAGRFDRQLEHEPSKERGKRKQYASATSRADTAADAARTAAVAGKLFPEDAARTTVRAKAIDSGKAAKIARLEAEGNNRKAKVSGSGGSKLAKKAKPAPGGGGIGKGKATAKVKSKAAAKASKGGKRK
ncbi:hypothetical protein EMIHUDRAFT_364204 [Emiliania huxleyi CCMP1516]|uniref:Ribosome biogenesis regulatory protein n=3 Tax=Emiliania huxleyi TaxID=2903 RepID=A0A0D3KAS8_EMIH1|nr:hypothetical protein EMIHUDRAFT_364204 [Emiliania huxleyi CCMP1516]EOD32863.1 hypothetical protein EMIHUDRAFT_364204 [Emiliania huxleyi CCMP1516]|eukprot:XP_005785292.1 hypothetical protein EMIHUDRAFT_364204 [Emiliania huxleyi CCMP1516]